MKTAISIPDALFDAADAVASRLGISRSELYARAVEAYLREHRSSGVTEALDRVYSKHPSAVHPALLKAQARVLRREDW